MKIRTLSLKILEQYKNISYISVKDKYYESKVIFSFETKQLDYLKDNPLTEFLKQHEYQFRKILHIKRKDTFTKGFELTFNLMEQKEVGAFNNLKNTIVFDQRDNETKSYPITKNSEPCHTVYTDGCYLYSKNKGAFSIITESPTGKYTLFTYKTKIANTCLIELLAAIKGVQKLKNKRRIRIVTDSQYVRKGLTEWLINWQRNDWHTANGTKARHIKYWKKFELLTKNKYIELEWVKSHSSHFENTICDVASRVIANQ